jgi:hypothetical protein
VGYASEDSGAFCILERAGRFFSKGSPVEDDSVLLDVVYLEREMTRDQWRI